MTFDAEVGRVVFEKHCLGCHTGPAPDLRASADRARQSREGLHYLVESIVDPDAVIAPADSGKYRYYMIRVDLTENELGSVVLYMTQPGAAIGK